MITRKIQLIMREIPEWRDMLQNVNPQEEDMMRDLKAWLEAHWVAAAGFMAAVLVAIWPLFHAAYSMPFVLLFLHSPG